MLFAGASLLEALLHLCQQVGTLVQSRCLLSVEQLRCLEDTLLPMDTDSDHPPLLPASPGPSPSTLPMDTDVEYIHNGATGGPGDRVACLVDMTSDVPAADTTILIPADSGNDMLYVRSGTTRLGISSCSIAKMWTAWKASPL
jgi:hypothetical protein